MAFIPPVQFEQHCTTECLPQFLIGICIGQWWPTTDTVFQSFELYLYGTFLHVVFHNLLLTYVQKIDGKKWLTSMVKPCNMKILEISETQENGKNATVKYAKHKNICKDIQK